MLAIAIRFALYINLMVLFGWPLFALYGTPVGTSGQQARQSLLLALSAAILSVAGMLAMTASLSGVAIIDIDRASVKAMVFETPMGSAWQARMAALAAVIALSIARRPVARLAGVGFAGIALVSLAWTGHGAAGDETVGRVQLIADVVHLLAAGAWVGALAALGILLARDVSRMTLEDVMPMRDALAGFSKIGAVFVALLIVTGAINFWILVGAEGAGRIGSSDYVRLLAIKLALFAAMLGLAATNRFRLTPALSRDLDAGLAPSGALKSLRRSIVIEVSFAVAVLAIVAWLGTLEPPASL